MCQSKDSSDLFFYSKIFCRALLFPPLTSRGRFLVHKTIEENFPTLKSFSIGHEPTRQTAVTFAHLFKHIKPEALSSQFSFKKADNSGSLDLDDSLNGPSLPSSQLLNGVSTSRVLNVLPVSDSPNTDLPVSDSPNTDLPVSDSPNTDLPVSDSPNTDLPVTVNKTDSNPENPPLQCRERKPESKFALKSLFKKSLLDGRVIKDKNSSTRFDSKCSSEETSSQRCSNSVSKDHSAKLQENSESNVNSRKENSFKRVKKKNISESGKKEISDNFESLSSDADYKMSVDVMVSESSNNLNRRRPKAQAGIYRPPPARSRQNKNVEPDDRLQYFDTLKEFHGHSNIIVLNKDSPSHTVNDDLSKPCDLSALKQSKSRRPDRQLYVPRRSRANDPPSCSTPNDRNERAPSPTNSICSVTSEYRYIEEQPQKVFQKPPLGTNRDMDNDKHKHHNNSSGRFKSETLNMIEKCLNRPEKSPGNNENINKYSPQENRSNHLIHSKENINSPEYTPPRHKRGKRNRKKGARSRDSSTDSRISLNDQMPYSNSSLNLHRYSTSYENLNYRDRSYSRNPSLERPASDSPSSCDWRRRGNYSLDNSPTEETKSMEFAHTKSQQSFEDRINSINISYSKDSSNTENENSLQHDDSSQYFTCNEDLSYTVGQSISPEKQASSPPNPVLKDLSESEILPEQHEEYDHRQSPDPRTSHENLDSPPLSSQENNEKEEAPTQFSFRSLMVEQSKSLNNEKEVESLSSTAFNESDSDNPKKFSFNWADESGDSWDALYDDSGNSLTSSANHSVNDAIKDLILEKPANEYFEFKPTEIQISDEDFGHIVEIYDFPASFKTQDLLAIFHDQKIDLKWVDDTHALGIFTTALQAADLLTLNHPFVKVRRISQGIAASRNKAFRFSDQRLPYKPRPQTSAALARRLVSGALGIKCKVPKEQRDLEKNRLKRAKEMKRKAAKQKDEAWEGTLANLSVQ